MADAGFDAPRGVAQNRRVRIRNVLELALDDDAQAAHREHDIRPGFREAIDRFRFGIDSVAGQKNRQAGIEDLFAMPVSCLIPFQLAMEHLFRNRNAAENPRPA